MAEAPKKSESTTEPGPKPKKEGKGHKKAGSATGPKKRKSGKIKHKKINRKHPEFELTYDMMLGIRTTVGQIESKPHRDKLKSSDMQNVRKLKFPGPGSNETPAHKMRDFKFKDYAPEVFRHIRARFGIHPADYLLDICGNFQYLEFISNSKSGQFFFYSHDRRYMIKTITQKESKFLREILPMYYEHLMKYPNTLLTRFYGMHRVKPHKKKEVHFLIMGSVFYTKRYIHITFDLKGSKQGRSATIKEKNSSSCVYKDNDFLEKKIKIQIGYARAKVLNEQLAADVDFLCKLNIMDYSLLLGVNYLDRIDENDEKEGKSKRGGAGNENALSEISVSVGPGTGTTPDGRLSTDQGKAVRFQDAQNTPTPGTRPKSGSVGFQPVPHSPRMSVSVPPLLNALVAPPIGLNLPGTTPHPSDASRTVGNSTPRLVGNSTPREMNGQPQGQSGQPQPQANHVGETAKSETGAAVEKSNASSSSNSGNTTTATGSPSKQPPQSGEGQTQPASTANGSAVSALGASTGGESKTPIKSSVKPYNPLVDDTPPGTPESSVRTIPRDQKSDAGFSRPPDLDRPTSSSGLRADDPPPWELINSRNALERRQTRYGLPKRYNQFSRPEDINFEAPQFEDLPAPLVEKKETDKKGIKAVRSVFTSEDGGTRGLNGNGEWTNEVYYMGIIDILTLYNMKKKLETFGKSFKYDKHDISAVDPKAYAERFKRFMANAII